MDIFNSIFGPELSQSSADETTSSFLFGYGSIINDFSRLATLGEIQCGIVETSCKGNYSTGGAQEGDTAVAAFLSSMFQHRRSWCYRSSTGFTALGLVPSIESSTEEVFGVLFPLAPSELALFDSREVGYKRVEIPKEYIHICLDRGSKQARERAAVYASMQSSGQPFKVWVYIPSEDKEASEEYPILQTYLDICIRGCLRWGGTSVATEFLRNTHRWSVYFLNDAPLSRRPWLHRLDYLVVDECMELMGDNILFSQRLHPEEFAARHLTALRGMWGVGPRNPLFIGRDNKLCELHQKLTRGGEMITSFSPSHSSSFSPIHSPVHPSPSSSSDRSGIYQAELVGFGGVGKTQLSVEYCHRHFGSTYGLIVWLRAESVASVAADLRRFAYDLGIVKKPSKTSSTVADGEAQTSGDVTEDTDDAVIEEVRRRMSKSSCRWLFVFDNVEDPSVVDSFLPRGRAVGHWENGHGINNIQTHSNTSTGVIGVRFLYLEYFFFPTFS